MEEVGEGGIAATPALGPAPSPYPAPEAPVDVSLSFDEPAAPLRPPRRTPGQADLIAGSSDQARSLEARVPSRPPQRIFSASAQRNHTSLSLPSGSTGFISGT